MHFIQLLVLAPSRSFLHFYRIILIRIFIATFLPLNRMPGVQYSVQHYNIIRAHQSCGTVLLCLNEKMKNVSTKEYLQKNHFSCVRVCRKGKRQKTKTKIIIITINEKRKYGNCSRKRYERFHQFRGIHGLAIFPEYQHIFFLLLLLLITNQLKQFDRSNRSRMTS